MYTPGSFFRPDLTNRVRSSDDDEERSESTVNRMPKGKPFEEVYRRDHRQQRHPQAKRSDGKKSADKKVDSDPDDDAELADIEDGDEEDKKASSIFDIPKAKKHDAPIKQTRFVKDQNDGGTSSGEEVADVDEQLSKQQQSDTPVDKAASKKPSSIFDIATHTKKEGAIGQKAARQAGIVKDAIQDAETGEHIAAGAEIKESSKAAAHASDKITDAQQLAQQEKLATLQDKQTRTFDSSTKGNNEGKVLQKTHSREREVYLRDSLEAEKDKKALSKGKLKNMEERTDINLLYDQGNTNAQGPTSASAVERATPQPRINLHQLVEKLVQKMEHLADPNNGDTKTTLVLHNEGLFKNLKIVISQQQNAPGQFNVAFQNLTAQGKEVMDANLDALRQAFELKGKALVLQQVTTSAAIIENQPSPQSQQRSGRDGRDDDEQQQGGQQQSRGQQQQRDRRRGA